MNAVSTPIEQSTRDRHQLVWREKQLDLIRRKTVDLCVWCREVEAPLSEWCQTIASTHLVDIDGVFALDDIPLEALLSALPHTPERDLLRDDVAQRAQTYGRIVGCDRVRIQLRVVHHQHCPRFHVDSVGVRLITTYAGPATQWLAETELVRTRIGKGPPTEVPVRLNALPRQLAPFDVALVKGRSWRGNTHFGLVHRSPPIDEQPRLVLTIDARHE